MSVCSLKIAPLTHFSVWLNFICAHWYRIEFLFWKFKFPFSICQVYIGNVMHLDWYLFSMFVFYRLLVCHIQWQEYFRYVFMLVSVCTRWHFPNAYNLNCLYEKYNCSKRCIHCNLSELNGSKQRNTNDK